MPFFPIDQLRRLDAVDAQDDMLPLGHDVIVVPLRPLLERRHGINLRSRARAVLADHSFGSVGAQELWTVAVVKLVAYSA